MLHHDALVAPAENQIVTKRGMTTIHNQSQHLTYLEKHSYEDVSTDDMEQVFNVHTFEIDTCHEFACTLT